MRFHLVVISVALLGATAVHHHRAHKKAKRHDHKQLTHHTASYAKMNSKLEHMLELNAAAEEQLSDSCRRLEEAILDTALLEGANDTAPVAALRGAAPAAKKLSGNLSETLKSQAGKLSELFSHLKSNIGDFNKREADGKKDSQVYADRLRERLKKDKKKLEDPKLSDFDHEMLVNRTRTEEHELKFWTQGRELQHSMFHSNLKLTHGLMSRVKTVMEAYKQMLATGKVDAKLTQVLHDTSATLPKALIQKDQQVQKAAKKIEKHLKISAKLLHRA